MEDTVEAYCLSKFQSQYTTLAFEQKLEVNRRWLEERKIGETFKNESKGME